jgi:hypothetical protein
LSCGRICGAVVVVVVGFVVVVVVDVLVVVDDVVVLVDVLVDDDVEVDALDEVVACGRTLCAVDLLPLEPVAAPTMPASNRTVTSASRAMSAGRRYKGRWLT